MGPVCVPPTVAVKSTPFTGAVPEDGEAESDTERVPAAACVVADAAEDWDDTFPAAS